MWDFIIKGPFIPTFFFDDKIVNEPDFQWTEEDKRKLKLVFKVKYLLISALSSKEFLYIFNFIPPKKCGTLLR